MREPVDAHELAHADGPGARHAADVIAREVDEHDVLGALLVGCAELGLHRDILGLVAPARPRAGDRIHHDTPVLDAHERLGRRADERGPRDVDQEHVRGRVHVAERAVERQRLGCGAHVEALRDDDLDAVALGDQLASASDPPAVLVGRAVRGDRADDAVTLPRQRYRRVERREDARDAARGVLTFPLDLVRDDQERVAHVVEAHDGVVDRERRLGKTQDVARRGGQPLEPARRLVTDVPDGPT